MTRRRRAAAVLALLLLLALLLSAAFMLLHGAHGCDGEHCPLCALLFRAERLFGGLALMLLVLCLRLRFRFVFLRRVWAALCRALFTPVSLRVKLTN
jgi:hypothetical protein